MAQSNSEHSRHWFFGAHLVINGEEMPESLMQIVKATLKANPGNSVIGFKDNSSAIRWGLRQPQADDTLDLHQKVQSTDNSFSMRDSLFLGIHLMLCCGLLTALAASLCTAPAWACDMSSSALRSECSTPTCSQRCCDA